VRAFHGLAVSSEGSGGVFDQVSKSRVMPLLDSDELSMMALFLSKIQEQVLTNGSRTIVFQESEISGDNPFTRHSKLMLAQRALSQLPCMRLFDDSGLKSWGISSAVRMIGNKAESRFEFDLSELGEEFVLGYAHAHRDLLAGATGGEVLGSFFEGQNPLCIWKSLWLDLDFNSRLVVLRIEQAMQLQQAWLQLDGTAGLSWDYALSGLTWAKRNASASIFERERKLLHALGKKLEDHGIFTGSVSQSYLAFSKDPGPTLVFRSSDGLKATQDLESYGKEVGSFFAKRRVGIGLIKLFSPENLNAWTQFYDALSSEDKNLSVTFKGRVYVAFDLFAEWVLRLDAKIPIAAHESLESLRTPVSEAWDLFKSKWQSFDFLKDLESLNLSLATEASIQDTQILERLSTGKLEKNEISNRAFAPSESGQRQKIAMPPRDQVARAAASDELEYMKKHDQQSYKKLCEAYLASLRAEDRELFQAIQKQMTPVIFETQLRARLIRYMIEFPSKWTTSKTASKP
jgi:hypothetical protein